MNRYDNDDGQIGKIYPLFPFYLFRKGKGLAHEKIKAKIDILTKKVDTPMAGTDRVDFLFKLKLGPGRKESGKGNGI